MVSRLLRVIIARSSDCILLVRVLVLPVRILHTSSLATYIVVLIFLCTLHVLYSINCEAHLACDPMGALRQENTYI